MEHQSTLTTNKRRLKMAKNIKLSKIVLVFLLVAFFFQAAGAAENSLLQGSAINIIYANKTQMALMDCPEVIEILVSAYAKGNDGVPCEMVSRSIERLLDSLAIKAFERNLLSGTQEALTATLFTKEIVGLSKSFCVAGTMDRKEGLDYRLAAILFFLNP